MSHDSQEEAVCRGHLGILEDTYAALAVVSIVTPFYEVDDGPVPEMMLECLRANIPQDMEGGKSLFDGV